MEGAVGYKGVKESMNGERDAIQRRSADERVLRIYVAEHCGTCSESRRLAKVISRRLPGISVEVVDMDHQEPVEEIFAVPTFCYRGKVISLGNPREDELVARIQSMEQESERVAGPANGRPGTVAPAPAAVAASPGRTSTVRNRNLTACCGGLGIVGAILCSLTMVAPALGLIAMQTSQRSMAGMRGTARAGESHLPNWWDTIVGLGPEILVVSVLLVAIAAALRRRRAAVLAIIGGLVLYLGMYAQSGPDMMYGATVFGIALLALAYVASLRLTLGAGLTLTMNRRSGGV